MKDDLHGVALFLMDQVSKRAKKHAQRQMDSAGMGVTVDQWVLLKVVERLGGGSQRDLAEASVRDPASITRTLDLLEKKGLLQRTAQESDRRQFWVSLTEEGESFVQQHMPLVETLRQESVAGMTEQEVETLVGLLRRMMHQYES